jgi:hypothetical protein
MISSLLQASDYRSGRSVITSDRQHIEYRGRCARRRRGLRGMRDYKETAGGVSRPSQSARADGVVRASSDCTPRTRKSSPEAGEVLLQRTSVFASPAGTYGSPLNTLAHVLLRASHRDPGRFGGVEHGLHKVAGNILANTRAGVLRECGVPVQQPDLVVVIGLDVSDAEPAA